MKKLIILLVMVFAVSMAMAQNTANFNQTGDKNNGVIDQLGTNMAATIIQVAGAGTNPTSGYFNEAYIDQVGKDHTATVDQNGPTGAQYFFGNYADIDQTGEHQSATVVQVGANKHLINGKITKGAYIIQTGDNNQATVEQRGTGNNAVINQDGSSNIGSHIIVADHRTGGTSGTIDQTGDYNESYQRLEPNGSGGSIQNSSFYSLQDGSSNVVNQTIKFEWGTKNSVSATQYGDGNKATQTQESYNMSNNKAIIIQGTNLVDVYGNSATQEILGTGSTQNIYQYGDDNIAVQTANGNYNTATTTQETNWNTANLIQNGNYNTSVVMQKTGDYNMVNLTQDGAANADILQEGDNNTVMGLLTDLIATSLNGSILDVDQIGSGNTLHLQQTNGASAMVYQNGLSNTSVVIQN